MSPAVKQVWARASPVERSIVTTERTIRVRIVSGFLRTVPMGVSILRRESMELSSNMSRRPTYTVSRRRLELRALRPCGTVPLIPTFSGKEDIHGLDHFGRSGGHRFCTDWDVQQPGAVAYPLRFGVV